MSRIKQKFSELKKQQRCALITYICGGDPDFSTSLNLLKALPENGADLIEIGVPFLDPAGDGPIIENASRRSISWGMNLHKIFKLAEEFRNDNQVTPLILMSYFNPLLKFGIDKIFTQAQESGFDGILIVDLPLEEEKEILKELKKTSLDFIRLIAPSSGVERIKKICKNASGFLYLISMFGITGTQLAIAKDNQRNLQQLQEISKLPIAIGFGIQNLTQAQEFAKLKVDGLVIGSVIVKEMGENIAKESMLDNALHTVKNFARNINL